MMKNTSLNKTEKYYALVFSANISIDDPITVGEYRKAEQYKLTKIGHEGSIELYTSVSSDPKYVDEEGCSFVGHILSAGHNFKTQVEAHQPKSNTVASYYLGQ